MGGDCHMGGRVALIKTHASTIAGPQSPYIATTRAHPALTACAAFSTAQRLANSPLPLHPNDHTAGCHRDSLPSLPANASLSPFACWAHQPEGSNCTASCEVGFTGRPTSTCVNGVFQPWNNTCQLGASEWGHGVHACMLGGSAGHPSQRTAVRGRAPPVRAVDDTVPPRLAYSSPPLSSPAGCRSRGLPRAPRRARLPSNRCDRTTSGTLCRASCTTGVGSFSSLCLNGAFSNWFGSCTRRGAHRVAHRPRPARCCMHLRLPGGLERAAGWQAAECGHV